MSEDIAVRLRRAIDAGDAGTLLPDALAEIERLRAVAGQARPSDFNAVKKETKT